MFQKSLARLFSIDCLQTKTTEQCAIADRLPVRGKITCQETPNGRVEFKLRATVKSISTNKIEDFALVEFKLWATVKAYEMLFLQLEFDSRYRAIGFAVNFLTLFSIAIGFSHFRILKNGSIKFCSFLGLRIEP